MPQEGDLTDYAFATLEEVSREDTVWSIVYDLERLQVSFITRENRVVRRFDLNSFDFDGADLTVNIDAGTSDDFRSEFQPYTFEANRDLIYSFFRHPFTPQRQQ